MSPDPHAEPQAVGRVLSPEPQAEPQPDESLSPAPHEVPMPAFFTFLFQSSKFVSAIIHLPFLFNIINAYKYIVTVVCSVVKCNYRIINTLSVLIMLKYIHGMTTMNTQQLECFTTLAKTLNYAKTSEQLNISQPAVSRQIQSLETEINAKLFNRTTRSVSLTQVGFQFLADAQQILSVYYHSLDWISTFHKNNRTVLRIGYADSHANWLISRILSILLSKNPNIVPELNLDQTDANLHKLTVSQLDLVIGIKDAKFTDDNIAFHKLHDDAFICVVRKDHPLARDNKKRRRKSVSSADIWPYRQIIDIPPYLLKHVFSRGHHIVPVNDELDNILCATTSEAYSLVLAGAGFTLIPEHLTLPHEELSFLKWTESPHAPMGIYYRSQTAANKNSEVYKFVRTAEKCITDALPLG